MSEIKFEPYPGIKILVEPGEDVLMPLFIQELSKGIERAKKILSNVNLLKEKRLSVSAFAEKSEIDVADAMRIASELSFEDRWDLKDLEKALKVLKSGH